MNTKTTQEEKKENLKFWIQICDDERRWSRSRAEYRIPNVATVASSAKLALFLPERALLKTEIYLTFSQRDNKLSFAEEVFLQRQWWWNNLCSPPANAHQLLESWLAALFLANENLIKSATTFEMLRLTSPNVFALANTRLVSLSAPLIIRLGLSPCVTPLTSSLSAREAR
jgi:hypothetical protein